MSTNEEPFWIKLAREDDFQVAGPDRNPQERLSECLAALQTAELAGADRLVLGILSLKAGRLYRQSGNVLKAEEYYVACHQYAGSTVSDTNRVLLARVQLEEVYLHFDQNGPDPDINIDAQKVLDLLSTNPNPRTLQAWNLMGQAYNVQAIVAQEAGQLERFHQLAENAIEAFGRAGDTKRRSIVEFNRATQQHRHGDDLAAIDLFLKYRQTLDLSEHDQLFLVAHNLANAYLAVEQLEIALQETWACQQEAAETNWIDQLFAIRTLADIYKTHATLAAEIGWQQTASTYVTRLEEAREAGTGLIGRKFAPADADVVHRYHYDLHLMMAEGQAAVGRIDDAREEIKQAQALQASNDNTILAEISGEIERVSAFVASEAKDWQEALTQLDQALKSFEQYRIDGKLTAGYIQRAQIYIRMNRSEAALRDLKTANRLAGRLQHQHSKIKINQLQRQITPNQPTGITSLELWQTYDQRISHWLNKLSVEPDKLMRVDLLLSRLIATAANQYRLDATPAFVETAETRFNEIEQVAQGNPLEPLVSLPDAAPALYIPAIHVLQELMEQGFSLEDIRRLCFDLKLYLPTLDFEDIPGDNRSAKARELLLYLDRRDLLRFLVSWMWTKRPDLRKRLVP